MRKIVGVFLSVLIALGLCACQSDVPETVPPVTTTSSTLVPPTTTECPTSVPTTSPAVDYTDPSVFQQKKWHKEIPEVEAVGVLEDGKPFPLPASEDNYRVMQGCCTDGTYLYAILEKKNQDVDGEKRSLCRVVKVDLSKWEILENSEPLELDHGNGMTFNTKTNEILVTNCHYNTNRISVVDPQTLQITRTFELAYAVRGIAYDATKDRYAVVVGDSSDIVIYDADFNEQAYYECPEPVSGKKQFGNQCISTDGEYLYLTYTGEPVSSLSGYEIICCYDWFGNFCGVFTVRMFVEIESTFHYNGEIYASFYNAGGLFYRLELDKSILKSAAN